jgi:hypothetical protein
MHLDGVTGPELGDVGTQVLAFNLLDDVHDFLLYLKRF